MPSKVIPFYGSYTTRGQNPSAASTKDQFFINCYPDVQKNPLSGKGFANLNKRPGCTSTTAAGSSYNGQVGVCAWTGTSTSPTPIAFSFGKTSGGSVVQIWKDGTQIGADLTSGSQCQSITETTLSGVPHLVVLVGYAAHFYPEGGAWATVTSNSYPYLQATSLRTIGEPAHMDGYMFIMCENGQIWNSDLNSVSTWTLTSFITAQSMPDGGCGLARHRNLIVAFGKSSIEFFQNAGNTVGSPLLPVGNALKRVGAAFYSGQFGIRTIVSVGDAVYFTGIDSESGAVGFYRLSGFEVKKISTSAIDRLLNEKGLSFALGFSGAMTLHGMRHLFSTLFVGVRQFVYCIDTDVWWICNFADTADQFVGACAGISGKSQFIAIGTGATAGRVYSISAQTPVYQDAVSTYTQTVQTDSLDYGTQKKKNITRVRPVCDTQSTASFLTIEYSDDDFVTFVTAGTIDLSSQVSIEQGLTRVGPAFRRRSLRATHSSNTANRIRELEVEYEVGTS